ncbi:MAG: putative hydro-lyase [Methylobacterium sp.]|nr:putative hydro-lyase [Methylobacterium sp.]
MNAQAQTTEVNGRPSRDLPPEALRMLIRSGRYRGATSGLAPGFVQGNLVILPKELGNDFLAFAHQNPRPCPVIGLSEPGSPRVPDLGASIDLRTDLPRYRVWKNGELISEVHDIRDHWRDDLVSFVIGCSFSFEEALLEDGIPLRHVACGANVAMYRTNIACTPAGPFAGPMVVSMRPLKPADAIRAIQITSRFPAVHGAPVHLGDPALIGIESLARPDYGDPVEVKDDEIPVFWACGVTPQAVIAAARPAFAITHAPGSMLITDKRNSRMSAF